VNGTITAELRAHQYADETGFVMRSGYEIAGAAP
jgi:hypothetical protein